MDFNVLKSEFTEINFDDKNFKRDALWLVKNLPNTLTASQKTKLKKELEELRNGTPLAYVMGYIPFLNYKIYVDKSTLIPRPETELLVDMLIKRFSGQKIEILDLCAGSGCIGIALQKGLKANVVCSDINPSCVEMIMKNAKENKATITVIQSNMFTNISQKFDLIVSNPPYIPTNEIAKLDSSVKDFEPKLALDGGDDGLDFYKTIANNAKNYLNENGILALEIGYNQASSITKMLQNNFKDIEVIKDYSKLDRFIIATRR